jgi:hypothetical protein
MFNAGVRGKRAKDGVGFLSTAEQFNQKSFLIPTVTSFSVTDVSYVPLDDTAVDTDGGQTIVINGSGFAPGATVQVGATTIGSVTFIDQNRLAFAAPALSSGSYTIYVTNSNGGTGILVSGLVYSGLPTYTTNAGTLGTVYETANINTAVVATGDAPITYTLLSGTLPAGANINSNGTITGTAPVDGSSTTYSFTIQATDGQLQDSTRAFTLTINTDVLSWSLANNTVYALDGNVVMSNVALSSTSSANSNSAVTFAANTLPTGVSLSGNTIFGTPTVEETVYTAVTATATQTGRTATRFVSWTVSLGDPYWKYTSVLITGNTATTFITDTSLNNLVMTPVGDVRANKFDPYTSGYYSNFFDGTGDYLTVPASTSLMLGSGDFTIEAWVYTTVATQTYGTGIIGTYDAATNGGWSLTINRSTGATYGILFIHANAIQQSYTTAYLPVNTWQHIAITRSGTTLRTFLNGVQVATGTYATADTVSATCYLGSQGTGSYLTGYISNARVVKGTAVYTSNFTPSTTPLTAIANTSLLTCSDNRLVDDSLNNHTITKNGDVSVSSFIPFASSANTTINNLYSTYFDGNGDYLVVGSAAQNLSGDFTIEAWVYQTVQNSFEMICGDGINYWSITSTNTFGTANGPGSPSYLDIPIGSAFPLNQWVHVALTRSGTNLRGFINGSQIGSTITNNTGAWFPTNPLNIGQQGQANYWYYHGNISNFRIVKGTALYTSNFTPSTSNLTAVANTSLLTCQNATLIDNSNNAFAITSFGQAQPIAVSPFTQTTTTINTTNLGSGYFDGTGDYLTPPVNAAFAMGTGEFTIECWVYFINSVANHGVFQLTTSLWPAAASGLAIYVSGGTGWGAYYNGQGQNSVPAPTVNTWYHVALVRSGTTTKLYVNGVSLLSAVDTTNYTGTYLAIGGYFNTSFLMAGYISNFRIVKGTALYTSNFAPPAQPLTAVANTQLLTLQTCQPATNKMFIDTSNNNFPIANVANTTQGTFSPYGSNWSNYFDGTGDYLTAASNAAFALPGNFTYECWFNSDNTATTSQWCEASVNNGLQIYYSGTQIFISAYAVSSLITYTYTMPVGVWTHLAVVRNGTGSNNLVLYINGVSVATATTTLSFAQGAFRVGGASYIFKGYISNARLVNGTAVYTANFTPPTAPLTPIANTSLLTCQSPSLIDNSPNAFAITKAGDVSVQEFSPFNPVIQTPQSYSGYFDGTGDYLTVESNAAFGFGTGDFTIEFWAYSTSSARQDWIDISDGSNRVLFYYSPEGAVSFYGNGGLRIAGSAIVLNTWTHYAISKSSGSTKMFVNGVQAGSTYATSQNYGTVSSVTIGKDAFGSTHITGHMSNLRIVKGTAVYTSNFTPSTTPLTAVANTSLLTCQSSTFIDNSTNAFTLTPFGDVKPRTFNPFGFTDTKGQSYTPALYGGSAYFDGVGDHLFTPATQQFTSAGDFTIELSFYLTSLAATNHLIGNYTANLTTDWLIEVINTGTMQVFLNGSTNRLTHTGLTVNQWYHLSISRTGTTVTGRINGANFNSTSTYTMSGTLGSATKAIYLGMRAGSSNPLFGYISDVRLISGTNVYPTPFVPSNVPLTTTANTSLLLNMDKAGIIDASRSAVFENTGDTKIAFETPYAGSYYSNYFDGTGDYLTFVGSPQTTLSGDYTFECWINPSNLTALQPIMCIGDYIGTGILFYITTAGKIAAYSSNAQIYLSTGTSVQPNNWTHIAVVRSGTTITGYINGIAQSTATNSATYSGTNTQIGRDVYNTGSSVWFVGYISNLRLVKGTALYTSAFTPPTTPLTAVANTSLLTCQSKSFVDNSTNALTITRNGDAIVKSANPFQRNNQSSIYFDGTTDYLLAPTSPNNATGTGNFTVEFWVLPTTFSSYKSMFGNSASAANATGWHCGLNASGNVFIYSNSAFKVTTSNAMTLNMWNHVAITRSGSTVTIYINGTSGGTWSLTTETFTDGRFIFGGAPPAGGSEWFAGYLADLRVTKGFARTITVPTSALRTN